MLAREYGDDLSYLSEVKEIPYFNKNSKLVKYWSTWVSMSTGTKEAKCNYFAESKY